MPNDRDSQSQPTSADPADAAIDVVLRHLTGVRQADVIDVFPVPRRPSTSATKGSK